MIIDFHIHVSRYEDYKPWVHQLQRRSNPELYEGGYNMTPELVEAELDKAGVDYGVVLAQDTPLVGIEVSNEYVLDFCRDHERLIPFASINPNIETSPGERLEELYRQGARGLKLYPPYQWFYPNDRSVYPLYAKAEELGVPVMIHTGSSTFKGARLKYGDPLFVDDVAVDFPELNLLLVHGGRGFWYDRAFFLARLHRNVYLEISGLPPQNLLRYFPELEKIPDKVVFGSDWPAAPPIALAVGAIKGLPLDEGLIEKILGGNARRLLGI